MPNILKCSIKLRFCLEGNAKKCTVKWKNLIAFYVLYLFLDVITMKIKVIGEAF